jgi:hypothetical protein
MQYILHGDFNLPFYFQPYFWKYVFAWSFQSGAPNLDGIIRLPGRLFDLVAFALFGNVVASYSYIGVSFLLALLSFYLFARKFLNINSRLIAAFGSILFAFNPSFLGNVSKVGLVAAAALLPLCLVSAKKFLETSRMRYLVFIIIMFNYSLLHPFTFVVNVLMVVSYFAVRFLHSRSLFKANWPKLLSAFFIGVLLNAYFLLPIVSVGSIDKSALSQQATQQTSDYTDLLGVANAKNFYTAFSLSRDVLKDYDFYNDSTKNLYYIGVYTLYVTIVLLYVLLQARLTSSEKVTIVTLLSLLLVTILLTTGLPLITQLIVALVNMPGGWIFRSPLKWQLYIPFFLVAIAVFLLAKIKNRYLLYLTIGILTFAFVFHSTFLFLDIYEKLLKPKTLDKLASFNTLNLDQKSLLYMSGGVCSDYSRNNPDTLGEFAQVTSSKQVQVKTIDETNIDNTNLATYNYVFSCKEDRSVTQLSEGRFKLLQTYDGGSLKLYSNTRPVAQVAALEQIFSTPDITGLNDKQHFTDKYLGSDFNLTQGSHDPPTMQVSQIFSGLASTQLSGGQISAVKPLVNGHGNVYEDGTKPWFFRKDASNVFISGQPKSGYVAGNQGKAIEISDPKASSATFHFQDEHFQYKNQIDNGSFESGTWQRQVADCFNVDNNPEISMKLDQHAASGKNALDLISGSHIACTSTKVDHLQPGATYLFEFSYQGDGAANAGYNIVFNDPVSTTISENPTIRDLNWHRYSRLLSAPRNATQATIYLYGYPPSATTQLITTRYDDFFMAQVPPIAGQFFMTTGKPQPFSTANVALKQSSPTSRLIQVTEAKGPFILAVTDSYHSKWRLGPSPPGTPWHPWLVWPFSSPLQGAVHLKLNGHQNAWLIDPVHFCKHAACSGSAKDGYGFTARMDFVPQGWFVIGIGISGLATFGCLAATVFARRRRRRVPISEATESRADLPHTKHVKKVRLG